MKSTLSGFDNRILFAATNTTLLKIEIIMSVTLTAIENPGTQMHYNVSGV